MHSTDRTMDHGRTTAVFSIELSLPDCQAELKITKYISCILCFREPNASALEMVKKFGFRFVFETQRMHVNGNPMEYKDTVYGLTSIDVCGF